MERKEKHIQDIDWLINEPLVNDYEPSFDFIDQVMIKVEELNPTKTVGKVVQISFRVVAAVAVIIFFINGLILLTALAGSSKEQVINDWTGIYEQNNAANWYDYSNNELFLADNEITK